MLPPVCVVTGDEEGVAYHLVNLTKWRRDPSCAEPGSFGFAAEAVRAVASPTDAAFTLIPLLTGGDVPQIVIRLPVSQRGWTRWVWGRWLVLALAVGTSAALLLVPPQGALVLPWLGAIVALPIATWFAWVRRCVPRYLEHDPRHVTLWVPSAKAAARIGESSRWSGVEPT